MSDSIKLTQPTPQALEDATKSSCSARPTQSADFWAVQYQYAAAVCVSPALKPEEQDAWTAFMQHAYGRYVAAIRASLHPSIAAAVGEQGEIHPKKETPPPKRPRLAATPSQQIR